MKTYKGLLCSILATRMLLGQEIETPTIQTQPHDSEAQSSQEAVIEYEKQIVSNAISGENKTSEIQADSPELLSAEKSVEASESTSNEPDPSDSSTFASAQKLFNEMWGAKETGKEAKKIKTEKTDKPEKLKRPTVISSKDSNPSITSAEIETSLPPNNLIPFTQEKTYAQNTLAGSDVKLPPMPDTLLPMGKPKLVAVAPKPKIKAESLERADHNADIAHQKMIEQESALAENEKTLKQLIPQEEPQVTVSPFLQWIRENQKSPEMAQEIQEQYKSNENKKDSTRSNDLFLKIRFPYTGSQSAPPSGGAVIYSTPQK